MVEYYKNRLLQDIDGEEWMPVVGYEELYHVSSFGRIKALASQEVKIWKCGRKYKSRKQAKILAQKKHNRGYKMVCLTKNEIKKYTTIHRLVAIAFINNPENKRTVNHKNGVKWDNRVDNLEWSTDSENGVHSFKELGRKGAQTFLGKFGKSHNRSKPILQFDLDGNLIREWENGPQIQRENGWASTNIQSACNGKKGVVAPYGFKWKYK